MYSWGLWVDSVKISDIFYRLPTERPYSSLQISFIWKRIEIFTFSNETKYFWNYNS